MKKFIGVLGLVLLCFGQQAARASDLEQSQAIDNPYEHPLLLHADSLYVAGKEQEALSQYLLAAEYFSLEEDWSKYVVAKSGQLKTLIMLEEYDDINATYREAMIIGTEGLGNDHPDLAGLYLHYGHYLYDVIGEYEAAETAMRQAAEKIKTDEIRPEHVLTKGR